MLRVRTRSVLVGTCVVGLLIAIALHVGEQSRTQTLVSLLRRKLACDNGAGPRPALVPASLVYRPAYNWKYYRPETFQQVRYEDPQVGTVYLAPVQADWLTNHEKHVFGVFDRLRCQPDGSTVFLDVGANDGTFSMLAAKRGCRVVSFELQHQCIELFSGTLGLNGVAANVTIVQRPVSDVAGKVFKLDNTGTCSGLFNVGRVSDAGQSLETVSLDSLFDGVRVALVKIDTEGHESFIVAGARKMFEDGVIDGAVVESQWWWGTGDNPEEKVRAAMQRIAFVYDYGYEVTCLLDWLMPSYKMKVWPTKAEWMAADMLTNKATMPQKGLSCIDILICRKTGCPFK